MASDLPPVGGTDRGGVSWKQAVENFERAMQQFRSAMQTSTEALVEWGHRMHAEAVRQQLERAMVQWSADERAEYQRLVRRLHESDPDLSLTDCMLAVGAAMEACRSPKSALQAAVAGTAERGHNA